MRHLLRKVLFVFLAIPMSGCVGPMPKPTQFAPAPTVVSRETGGDYRLRSGDELAIKFYYQKDLNEEQAIRPDGKITLQLVGDVQAAGRTPAELAKDISEQCRKFTKQYQATVIVRRTVQDRIFVGGEVREPGPFTYVVNTTALQALFQSGGFLDSGELASVMLIRQNPEGKPLVCCVDLQDPANDFTLQPFDVLYVPRSDIASADLFVYQYIERLIPISRSLGFSFVYDLTKTGVSRY